MSYTESQGKRVWKLFLEMRQGDSFYYMSNTKIKTTDFFKKLYPVWRRVTYQIFRGVKGEKKEQWSPVYRAIILPVCVSLDSNHGTQMLRVSDIFPQAVSGSLAAFVGSCVGSLGAASGSVLWLCSWWAALCCWMPFPSASPWAFRSSALCKSPVKQINGLF